jgi:16S rRNA processing protein RimM
MHYRQSCCCGIGFFIFTDTADFMERASYFKAGFIMRPHGLKGEVTIALDADSPAEWDALESVMIEIKGRLVPHFIEAVSVSDSKAFLKLEDINTPEAAQALKGCSLFLPKESRPALPRGDFYNDEVIGFEVEDESLGLLGQVRDIEMAGPARFLIVMVHEKEVMIPVQAPLLKSLNRSKKKILVNLPDGFLDI